MKKHLFFLLLLFQTHFAFGNFVCDDNIYGYRALYTPNEYTCNSGYYLPAGGVQCTACPNGFTCSGGTFVFNPYIFQGLSFENIPNNTMNNACADNFPSKLYAKYERNTYTCSAGQYLPADGVACVQCLANSYCVGGTYTYSETIAQGITACGSGTRSPAGSSSASQCIPFYTCTSGQYLPKNTTTCTSCPSGYTCAGGTYEFDANNDQGITANSINLTWQDENGTTMTTNSCAYGTAITLPPNPIKPGYIFNGWKVVNN